MYILFVRALIIKLSQLNESWEQLALIPTVVFMSIKSSTEAVKKVRERELGNENFLGGSGVDIIIARIMISVR